MLADNQNFKKIPPKVLKKRVFSCYVISDFYIEYVTLIGVKVYTVNLAGPGITYERYLD